MAWKLEQNPTVLLGKQDTLQTQELNQLNPRGVQTASLTALVVGKIDLEGQRRTSNSWAHIKHVELKISVGY